MNFLKTDLGQTIKKTATAYLIDNYVKGLNIEKFDLQRSLAVNAANEFFLAGKIQPYLADKVPGGFKYGEELAVYISGQIVGSVAYDYFLGSKFDIDIKERLKSALILQSICLISNKSLGIK